ncbi:MAG: DnaA regulatory inactivator Hda [Burkholderiaceae bacterium]|jgi:DnaA family protein|nr:MAG: DnaA regulatory inactivator Hda [Burkholderiaceae bacterium]
MKQIPLNMAPARGPSFEGFIAGPNAEALRHLELWTQGAIRAPVPTYLWGPSGSGKTHLLLAARAALAAGGAAIGWLDASIPEPVPFDERWSALLLDDVDRYGAVQQHAAFNWFVNATSAPGGRARWVLAAGAAPPADLALREDLRSRLGWGHVFALQRLGEADCRAALQRQAEARGVVLGAEVVDFVLARFSRDLGHLVQLLDLIDRYSLQTQRAVTIPMIRAMLEEA